jgi:hypothetical protein
VFEQYEKLTQRSGLELNADKTEILALNDGRTLVFDIKYLEQQFNIKTVKELKICGLWYCRDADREYNLNITEKIEKLSQRIKLWKSRNLTFEGKSLIIKTF